MIDLPPINGLAVALIVIGLLFLWLLVRFQMGRNKYDILDVLIDQSTGKASLDSHVILFYCVLSAWYIVSNTLRGLDVGAQLVQILGIMVGYRGVKQGIQAYAAKPPALPDPPAQVEQQINVSRESPAVDQPKAKKK